jgi:hypothetical protein
VVNSLTPIPGLFDIILQSFTFVTPSDPTVQSLTLDEISQVLGWGCYDYAAKQQLELASQTRRNCPFTLESGTTLSAWSQPLNQFPSLSEIPMADFVCCAGNTAQPLPPTISNPCSYQTSCWDSPYCARILYSVCSTDMRNQSQSLILGESFSLYQPALGNIGGGYNTVGSFKLPSDYVAGSPISINTDLSGTFTGSNLGTRWGLYRTLTSGNLYFPTANLAYTNPGPETFTTNTTWILQYDAFGFPFYPNDTINVGFTGGGNIGANITSVSFYFH